MSRVPKKFEKKPNEKASKNSPPPPPLTRRAISAYANKVATDLQLLGVAHLLGLHKVSLPPQLPKRVGSTTNKFS